MLIKIPPRSTVKKGQEKAARRVHNGSQLNCAFSKTCEK